jgi:endoglucanase
VQLVQENPEVSAYLNANPELRGRRALEIMDAVIDAAGRQDLKVILDSHRADAAWSLEGNGLWYTRDYPEAAWLESWLTLARRYRGTPTVIGCDLHNEPGSPPPDASAWPGNGGAVWGYGDHRWWGRPRDWSAAATRAGTAILDINPELLIFVEGVRGDPAGPFFGGQRQLYWFGGNLSGVRRSAWPWRWRARKITLDLPNRLVYSVHDYGPDMHRGIAWCQQGTTAATPDACYEVWDQTWGYIAQEEIAPIWVGEFGTVNGYKPDDPAPHERYTHVNRENPQGAWFSYLVDYIDQNSLSWSYWALNGTQSPGPGRNAARPEWYGVLDPTWTAPASAPLIEQLARIQGPPVER